MRIEFALLLIVTFISIFVMAYSEEGEDPPEPEIITVEKTVWMPKTEETTVEKTIWIPKRLPHTGGLAVGSMLLPAAALLVSLGILAYAVLCRLLLRRWRRL